MIITHHDLLPLVVLGEVDVGPELGAADGGAHQVLLQVRPVHKTLHDVVPHDLKGGKLKLFHITCGKACRSKRKGGGIESLSTGHGLDRSDPSTHVDRSKILTCPW